MCATCRAHDIRSDLWDQKKNKTTTTVMHYCQASLTLWSAPTCVNVRVHVCQTVFPVTVPSNVHWRMLPRRPHPLPRAACVEKKKGGRPYYTIHQPPNSPYSSQMTFTNYFLPFLETAPWFLSGLRHAHCHVETNKLAAATVRVFFDWGGANVQTDLWCPFKGCCCVEQYG